MRYSFVGGSAARTTRRAVAPCAHTCARKARRSAAARMSSAPLPLAEKMDGFTRHKFIGRAIAGEVVDDEMNAAVWAAMRFRREEDAAADSERGSAWSDEQVDSRWREICRRAEQLPGGVYPPDFARSDAANDVLRQTLPEDEVIIRELREYVEVIYGEDITKVERQAAQPDFLRRETLVMWLRKYGGF